MMPQPATSLSNQQPPNLIPQNSNPTASNFLPIGPPQFDANQFSFIKTKQRRYVDVLQPN